VKFGEKMARRKHQQRQQLELDIDMRLASIWADAIEMFHEDALPTVGTLLRAAYGKGYTDALIEVRNDEPEKLLKEHGYVINA
jgi:hypothetical protein